MGSMLKLFSVNLSIPIKRMSSRTWRSHTLGVEGSEQQKIQIDRTVLRVSTNLAEALRELREKTTDVMLWIDQLCINQDDGNEKKQQVQEIKSIYE
jgi:hypothetical protein